MGLRFPPQTKAGGGIMVRRASLAVVSSLALSVAATSQTYLGRILGTVTDSSHAIVAKAKVTVINLGTSATRNLETNEPGEYLAANAPAGEYKVLVEASSVNKIERA